MKTLLNITHYLNSLSQPNSLLTLVLHSVVTIYSQCPHLIDSTLIARSVSLHQLYSKFISISFLLNKQQLLYSNFVVFSNFAFYFHFKIVLD